MGKPLAVTDIAWMCDHSLLRPTLTDADFDEGIAVVKKYRCRTVMVAPYDVPKAVQMLKRSTVEVSTVIDFPHGSNLRESKVFQAVKAIENGATHLDMVMAISRAVAGNFDYVEEDIRGVVEIAHAHSIAVKVILETCFLTPEMIVASCRAAERAGADFVKTSTGYGTAGARIEDCVLMRSSVSDKVQVKASGGIRTLDQTLAYRKAGCSMIGSRATAAILEEAEIREKGGTLRELD